ncbi:2,3-dihydroxybenzoate-AMP ligase [Deinococcus arenae]|uniref:2,3-dihydroxybenzoate-AMP ligase n=1 Tax=Deinococcus arenae TaxID=1452751 RepID=A0A8H9GTJ5_9DEIO|nr:AMP-binding protein [Deinococcus arenae]GGM59183.1 2,3-dihydroxybenzoate-AMP ligase [Deinococcus arenae]
MTVPPAPIPDVLITEGPVPAEFTPWPPGLARAYRAAGYWRGEPFSAWLRALAGQFGSRTALVGNALGPGGQPGAWVTRTYAELDAAASGYAAALAARGLHAGDRVILHLPNSPDVFEVLLGLLRLGARPILALAAHRAAELTAFATQAQVRALITGGHPDAQRVARAVQAAWPDTLVLTVGDPEASLPLLAADAAAWTELPARTGVASDVALYQLSGGSTGTPKLIPRTHDDYLYSIRASGELCGLTPDTVFLAALPATHNFTLTSPGAFGTLHAGGTVVTAPGPAPDVCAALIERCGVTHVALVPSALLLWLRAPQFTPARPESTLRVVQVGGAPLAPDVARQVPERLGAALQQVFGMAEGLVNYVRSGSSDDVTYGTQGRPISPHDEILIVDDEDRPVPDGTPGHLLTRGPYTIRGYFRAPEHNARAFTPDGYYRTGDIVTRRPDGHLIVQGRHKDQINRGGEKIAAEEIEHALLGHPRVFQAALIGLPDPWLGERTCAVVQPRVDPDQHASQPLPDARALTLDLRRYLLERGFAPFKLPDRVEVLPTLPRTPFGKLDKPALRARYAPTPALSPAQDAPDLTDRSPA